MCVSNIIIFYETKNIVYIVTKYMTRVTVSRSTNRMSKNQFAISHRCLISVEYYLHNNFARLYFFVYT